MWNNQKMQFVTSIHNDAMKCFPVVIQETYKLVAMGCINFEDCELIKRWWVGKKMNAIGGMFKDKKKSNRQK
jgi:hypothetical protein